MNVERIVVLGECMVELRQQGELFKPGFGGDTLNTALYLARLTAPGGVTTAFATGLGDDPFSQSMLEAWQQEGIDTSLVSIDSRRQAGLYVIRTAADGERSFQYWRNDSAARYWLQHRDGAELTDRLGQFDLIYLSGISLAILPADSRNLLLDVLAQCKRLGVTVAFDNNFRPGLWESVAVAQGAYRRVLSLTDLAFLTVDDEMLLWGDSCQEQAIERAQSLGVGEIALKRGGEPCLVVAGHGQHEVAANAVGNVVDTTAAGDAFSAGYLAARIRGKSPVESAKAGHRLAAEVIQHRGAIIPPQAMPEIEFVK